MIMMISEKKYQNIGESIIEMKSIIEEGEKNENSKWKKMRKNDNEERK